MVKWYNGRAYYDPTPDICSCEDEPETEAVAQARARKIYSQRMREFDKKEGDQK